MVQKSNNYGTKSKNYGTEVEKLWYRTFIPGFGFQGLSIFWLYFSSLKSHNMFDMVLQFPMEINMVLGVFSLKPIHWDQIVNFPYVWKLYSDKQVSENVKIWIEKICDFRV